MSCHHCHKEHCEAEDSNNEKRELFFNVLTLVIGIIVFAVALTLTYVDSSSYSGGIEWSYFLEPSFFSTCSFAGFLLYILDYLFLSSKLLKKMIEEIKEKNFINEFTLMIVATIGALAIAEFMEAVLVGIFAIIGEILEDYATEKSRKSIKKLINNMPLFAHKVEKDGHIENLEPNNIEIGSVLEIRPGEKIAIDGKVISGETQLDMSSINGESLPKDISTGDIVYSGSVNLTSVIRIETIKSYDDSTLSKIMSLVEEQQDKKAKSEKFITRFSKIYTPAVVIIALLVFIIGYGISGFVWTGENAGETWLYRALSILLTSCPCSLLVSVPISFFASIGQASKFGVLVKGSLALEDISHAKEFFFDKTGTITNGQFVLENKVDQDLLKIAASIESKSTHPLSKGICNSYSGELLEVTNFLNVAGKGVEGTVEGKTYLIGTKAFLLDNNIEDFKEEESPFKVLYLGEKNGKKLCHFVVADEMKKEAPEAIRYLKEEKVEKTTILSGDDKRIVDAIREKAGLDNGIGELLPQDKLAYIQENSKKHIVTYVGDGINDSPSLLASHVGIAMGALGSDAAIEASDIVVMDDDLTKVPETRRLSRHAVRNVVIGVFFAIVVKILVMIIIACGWAGSYSMILGIFSDTGIMVLAVLHSMSMMLYKTKYIKIKRQTI